MAAYGHDDANRAAAGAWLPIPLHLATAALLATGRRVLRIGGGSLVVTLLLWTALQTITVLGSLGNDTDLADVGIVLVLLASTEPPHTSHSGACISPNGRQKQGLVHR